MARISRREFLRHVGHAGPYDVIIVGGGTAGTIVAAKLQTASDGRKRILLIEADGPTAAAIGGTAWSGCSPTAPAICWRNGVDEARFCVTRPTKL